MCYSSVCSLRDLYLGAMCSRAPSTERSVLTRHLPPRVPSLPHRMELSPLSNEHTQENKTCFSKVGGRKKGRKGGRKEKKENNAYLLVWLGPGAAAINLRPEDFLRGEVRAPGGCLRRSSLGCVCFGVMMESENP